MSECLETLLKYYGEERSTLDKFIYLSKKTLTVKEMKKTSQFLDESFQRHIKLCIKFSELLDTRFKDKPWFDAVGLKNRVVELYRERQDRWFLLAENCIESSIRRFYVKLLMKMMVPQIECLRQLAVREKSVDKSNLITTYADRIDTILVWVVSGSLLILGMDLIKKMVNFMILRPRFANQFLIFISKINCFI